MNCDKKTIVDLPLAGNSQNVAASAEEQFATMEGIIVANFLSKVAEGLQGLVRKFKV
ncbi:hypothetical protein [Metabacillus endolithicus]|uniref:Uncharacterized protein n=1 Tax=Metabacillus endolithicus TaxID=1535204 RepID=A0ABW5BWS4_9BACI|nr:hypothetical protein [Metabacillus endolithicus]UPG66018.1 hypothetical protein MVE64_21210 [Metabacillus endolithicus]